MTTDSDSPLQRGFFERLWDRYVPRTPVFRFLTFVRPYGWLVAGGSVGGILKFVLPLAKIGADLENPVLAGQMSQLFEAHQDIRGEAPGACAYFENRSAVQRTQDLRALQRHATAEQAGNFRRSREISAGPEFPGAAAVVADPRRVQHKIHEALEAEPAAGCRNLTL